jgi:hypothetical protein
MRESLLAENLLIRPDGVAAELAASQRRGWAPHQLWYLFVLEMWMRAEAASGGRFATHVQGGVLV